LFRSFIAVSAVVKFVKVHELFPERLQYILQLYSRNNCAC